MIDEAQSETRIIRKIFGIRKISPENPSVPTILHVECGTETGPLVLRLSQIAAVELTALLNKHPLTCGSA
jgi:hypothetical protein